MPERSVRIRYLPALSRTVVIQSYKPGPLSRWQQSCVDSVTEWARMRGWEYRYVDDRLFAVVPDWYRERCGPQKLPVTDLGRLLLMCEALQEPGCEQALWLDADVLVFDPEALNLDGVGDYAFCREFWLWREPNAGLRGVWAVNNAVMSMSRGTPLLDFYIRACEAIVRAAPANALEHNAVGTKFLTALAAAMPLPVVPRAGLLSPGPIADIAGGGAEFARAYAQHVKERTACVNLRGSLIGREIWGVTLDEKQLDAAVATLLETRGAVINRWCGS
jgi:hypothetical protein